MTESALSFKDRLGERIEEYLAALGTPLLTEGEVSGLVSEVYDFITDRDEDFPDYDPDGDDFFDEED